jgi:hypothetical protein
VRNALETSKSAQIYRWKQQNGVFEAAQNFPSQISANFLFVCVQK